VYQPYKNNLIFGAHFPLKESELRGFLHRHIKVDFPRGHEIRKILPKKGREMLTIQWENINHCTHSHDCECPLKVWGKSGTPLEGFAPVRLEGTKTQQVRMLTKMLLSRYKVVDGVVIASKVDDLKDSLYNSLNYSPNMKKVPPPIPKKAVFIETPPYEPPPLIRDAYKYSDFKTLPRYFKGGIDWDYLYSDLDEVDRFHTEVRKRSAYWCTYGKKNGRPFRIAALDGAAGQKNNKCDYGIFKEYERVECSR